MNPLQRSLFKAFILLLFKFDVICNVFLKPRVHLKIISADAEVIKIKKLLDIHVSSTGHLQNRQANDFIIG
jgi:hypothetical protein